MSGDKYQGKNVGAMGRKANVKTVTFDQRSLTSADAIDFESLVREISTLRVEARKRATLPEHDQAIANLGHAEAAAKASDTAGTLSYLKKAGSWASRVATEFSASVVAKLIEEQLN